MKKTLILVLIAVFVVIPLASFAKTAMSDRELGAITGKAFFSISQYPKHNRPAPWLKPLPRTYAPLNGGLIVYAH